MRLLIVLGVLLVALTGWIVWNNPERKDLDSEVRAQVDMRFVGLSTAMANAHDISEWLDIPSDSLFNFKPSVRPVPLEVHRSVTVCHQLRFAASCGVSTLSLSSRRLSLPST